MQIIQTDPSTNRPDTKSTSKQTFEKYFLTILSTDDGVDLNGYYIKEIEVPIEVYAHVKLLEEKLKTLEESNK